MTPDPATIAALAPTGTLRASINVGNPILARTDPGAGAGGVSVDLARAFARLLGVGVALQVFDTAAQSVQAVGDDHADIGFFAIDPQRAGAIAFTAPYLLIEGSYLVRDGSPLRANAEVDVPGRSVVVGQGSAYDLHLTRTLQHARIVRAPSSPAVVQTFVDSGADVAAGVRQQLESDAARLGGLRLLAGHFMLIRQAMGVPRTRGAAAAALLSAFVEDAKAGGQVAAALRRHGVQGASVAPAGD